MLNATRTLIGKAKVVRNRNTILGLQMIQLIVRTLGVKQK
jgi:hypothetical protein